MGKRKERPRSHIREIEKGIDEFSKHLEKCKQWPTSIIARRRYARYE